LTSQERITLALNHKEADRVGIHDTPWETTVKRWHKEGLPENISPEEYFGYELKGFGPDTSFQLPEEVIEETEEYKIVKNSFGAIVKNWKEKTSTPELIDFTVNDRKKWEELKPLTAWNEKRVNWEKALEDYKKEREKGKFIYFSGVLGYDKTQGIVGPERLLISMIDDPEWVKDMFNVSAEMLICGCEEMLGRGFEFDGAFLCDDLGYRNATMFSPKIYKELLFPAHKKINDFMKSKKIPTILHSCGRVLEIVPLLIEAGWNCLQPLEVKAGMDLIKLKKDFGDVLSFMGGIDVRCMKEREEVIEEEIKTKITFAKKGGGYIYSSDHSVPDDISFENYKKVISLVLKYGKY
jgi:uroporphyrinogen decarboxylase